MSQRNGLLRLWAGILLPPFAWFLHQQLSYLLVSWACTTGRPFTFYVVTVLMLLPALGGGLFSWLIWKRLGHDEPDEAGGVQARGRFMAVAGLLSSIMFCLVILAQALPSFMLNACEP